MSHDEILIDYRSDWILRCLDIQNVNYSFFDKKNLYISIHGNCGEEISDVLCEIFSSIKQKHKVSVNLSKLKRIDTVKPQDFVFVLNFSKDSLTKLISSLKSCGCNAIIATDNTSNCDGESFPYLYCPNIYGAGYSLSACEPKENSSTNILDLFGALIFSSANYQLLQNTAYYCGHGKSEFVKSLTETGYKNLISLDDGAYMLSFFTKNPSELFYFKNTYGGKLSLLHELLFKCLCEFDRICKKHNIKYFLGGGTLLGAVRHGGMIPWDDDMDVMMLRDDYEKFLCVVQEEIDSDEFFFQSSKTDVEYHSVFTKIRLNGTKFVTEFSQQFKNMHQGIFIDIFVHDKTSNNKLGQKLHVFKTLFARSMVFNKWAKKPMHFYGKLKLVCKLATAYIKKTDIKKLETAQHKVITHYNKKNTSFLYDGTGEHLRHGAFPSKWLEDTTTALFNGKEFPIPKMYDEYLTYSYGDWKKLIPPSKRKVGHDIVKIDFGKYDLNTNH